MLAWGYLHKVNDLEPVAGLGRIMPKVSVVIPNYNHARYLRRRIDSVLQQTYQDFEIILLDDNSTDDSRQILSSYAGDPRVRLEFNSANSGSPFKQWNKGVRMARSEYVWIAESDDYADERFLERLVAVLDSESEVAFAYCQSWRVSADDQIEGFADLYFAYLDPLAWTANYCVDGLEECRRHLVLECTVPNASAALFRKAVFEAVGGADESFRMCADWKLWISMALKGKVAFLSEPLNYYRCHNECVRGRDSHAAVNAEECLHVARWVLQEVTPPDSVRRKMRRHIARNWTRPMFRKEVPLAIRWAILRRAMTIDPYALWRLVQLAFRAIIQDPVRVWIRDPFRVWIWHPLLNVTRPVRHSLGLRQRKVRPLDP